MALLDFFRNLFVKRLNLDNPANWSRIGDTHDLHSSSGIAINEHSAMSLPTVRKAVNLIANDIAEMPWSLYQQTSKGKVEVNNRITYLLGVRPNDTLTPFELKRCIMKEALLKGNGYAYINRLGNGTPDEIIFVDTARVNPKRKEGKLVYEVIVLGDTGGANQQRIIDAQDMLVIRGVGHELEGDSILHLGRDSLGLNIAMQKFQAIYFRQGISAQGYIKHPGKLTPEAQDTLLNQWARRHEGVENSHKPCLLLEGAEFQPLSIKPVDAELSELREQEIVMLSNWFGIPPHKLGSSKNVSYSSLEIEQQAYIDDAISPWVTVIEQECFRKLLSDEEQAEGQLCFCLDTDKLIRPPRKERYDAHRQAIESGWKSPEEVREEELLNPVANLDQHYISANVTPIVEEDEGDQIQNMALNGLQISSLLLVVTSIADTTIAPEAGKAILAASFPLLTPKQINDIVDNLVIKKPDPPMIDTGNGNTNHHAPDTAKPAIPQ